MYKEIYDDYIALNNLHTNKVIDETQRLACVEELRSRVKSAQQSVQLTALRRVLAMSIFINIILLAVVLFTIGGN